MKKIGNKIISAILAGMMLFGSVPMAEAATVNGLESPIWITEENVLPEYMPNVDPWVINQSGMLEIKGQGASDVESGYLAGWTMYMRHQTDSDMPSSDGNYLTYIGGDEQFSTTDTWYGVEKAYYPVIEYVFNSQMYVSDSDKPMSGTYNFLLNRHRAIGVAENLELPHKLEVSVKEPWSEKVNTSIAADIIDTGVDKIDATKIEYLNSFKTGSWYCIRDVFKCSDVSQRRMRVEQAVNGRLPVAIASHSSDQYLYSEVSEISNIFVDSTGYKAAITISAPKMGADEDGTAPEQSDDSYIYDQVDSGKTIDFVGTLDDVTDKTSAVDAVDQALTEVTDEQKQSVTGIDKLTLLAEEAAAKANTVSVDSGVINVTSADIPATADSALTATTGVLSDAGVNMQRNPRAIVNYDAGSSETVSVTTESLPETVDKVRVTTDYAMATVDAQQASSFTMSDRGNQTIEVNFDTDYETVVTVSFPGMSANDTYKAVVDAEGKPVGGKYNPATGTLEAKLTESGIYRVVNNEANFSDIKTKSQEMQDAIKELASKGIINGTTETTYAPDDTISRAEVTALLMRTLSLLNPNANGGFADVTSANWYCGAAGSAKEHNIINGFEDNTFRGDAVIAKDQIVVVSSRTLREQMDYKTPSDVNGELSVYSDAGSIENWAREDVALATMTNLVLKRTDGKFGGSAGMTRGDAAIIIKRLFDKMW